MSLEDPWTAWVPPLAWRAMDASQSALDSLRTVEFRETLKGYHRDDVDEYLEKAAVEAEGCRSSSARAASGCARPRSASPSWRRRSSSSRASPPPAEPAVADDTLQRTLLLAQKFVDQTKADAEAQADTDHLRGRGQGADDDRAGPGPGLPDRRRSRSSGCATRSTGWRSRGPSSPTRSRPCPVTWRASATGCGRRWATSCGGSTRTCSPPATDERPPAGGRAAGADHDPAPAPSRPAAGSPGRQPPGRGTAQGAPAQPEQRYRSERRGHPDAARRASPPGRPTPTPRFPCSSHLAPPAPRAVGCRRRPTRSAAVDGRSPAAGMVPGASFTVSDCRIELGTVSSPARRMSGMVLVHRSRTVAIPPMGRTLKEVDVTAAKKAAAPTPKRAGVGIGAKKAPAKAKATTSKRAVQELAQEGRPRPRRRQRHRRQDSDQEERARRPRRPTPVRSQADGGQEGRRRRPRRPSAGRRPAPDRPKAAAPAGQEGGGAGQEGTPSRLRRRPSGPRWARTPRMPSSSTSSAPCCSRSGASTAGQAVDLRAEADSLALEREPGDVQFDEESGEGGTVTVDRERNLALSAQASAAVEEIDDALRKIDRKSYGGCERCHQADPQGPAPSASRSPGCAWPARAVACHGADR